MQMMKKDRLILQGTTFALIIALISLGSVALYNHSLRSTSEIPDFKWDTQSNVALSSVLQDQEDQLLALIANAVNQSDHCGCMESCEGPYPFFQGNISEYFSFRVNYSNTTKAWNLELTEYKPLLDNAYNLTTILKSLDNINLTSVNEALYRN